MQIHLCSTAGMQDFPNHYQIFKRIWRTHGQSKSHEHSPADAVSCERVTAACAVTGPAAVVSKAPVPHHTPVTMWPCHPRLARAVTIAGVTEGHWAERKDSWSNWMTGTHYNREDTQGSMSNWLSVIWFPFTTQRTSKALPLASWYMLREWKLIKLRMRR